MSERTRQRRIEALTYRAYVNELSTIDEILKASETMWPYIGERTRLEYCQTALRLLRQGSIDRKSPRLF